MIGSMAQMRQMRLTVPEPPARPGEEPDFSHVPIPPAGAAPKLPIDAPPEATHPLTTTIIRVLDEEGAPVGDWVPGLSDEIKLRALRHLIETRLFDEQALLLQRQGKAGFAIQSKGEEAIAVGSALAVDATSPGYGPASTCTSLPTVKRAC